MSASLFTWAKSNPKQAPSLARYRIRSHTWLNQITIGQFSGRIIMTLLSLNSSIICCGAPACSSSCTVLLRTKGGAAHPWAANTSFLLLRLFRLQHTRCQWHDKQTVFSIIKPNSQVKMATTFCWCLKCHPSL